jgi:hypothetical protein
MSYFRVGQMEWRTKSAEEVARDIEAAMPRLMRLEARVARANQRSLLGPFVPGTGDGSAVATHRMELKAGHDGWWVAAIYNAPANPVGVRTVCGTGLTADEAAMDAFALLWLGR